MPHQTEPNANNALAVVIRGMLPSCTVLPETTQVFPDHPGRHADVLITAQGSSPVAVEAEYDPAPEVEQDARERLGLVVAHEPRPIEAAIAVRYPTDVESAYDLAQAISDAQLSFCVLYDDGSRFPQSGWLTGSVTDLADLIRLVSVPSNAVEAAAAALQQGIERLPPCSTTWPSCGPTSRQSLPGSWAWPTCSKPAAWPAPSSPTRWSFTSASLECTTA